MLNELLKEVRKMLLHPYRLAHMVINWEAFAEATGNCFQVVRSNDYKDPKGRLPNGKKLQIKVLRDDYDYGVDKYGRPLDSNVDQNFDVVILHRRKNFKHGDYIRLLDFDQEHSYFIEGRLHLRFKDAEILDGPDFLESEK